MSEDASPAIEGAVSTAYKVWREYLEYGRKAAEQYTPFRDWSAAMTGDLPPDQSPMGQWIQMWQQMARAWMGYMAPFAPGSFPLSPFGPFGATAPTSATELTLELECDQPAKLTVRLLRPLSGAKLRAVLFNSKDELLHMEVLTSTLRLKLPAGTSPGTYSGHVLDATGASYGALTLTVGHPSSRRI